MPTSTPTSRAVLFTANDWDARHQLTRTARNATWYRNIADQLRNHTITAAEAHTELGTGPIARTLLRGPLLAVILTFAAHSNTDHIEASLRELANSDTTGAYAAELLYRRFNPIVRLDPLLS